MRDVIPCSHPWLKAQWYQCAGRRREHIAQLNKRAAGADLRLKRLYDAIDAGVADLDYPALQERVASLKAIRDQAQADSTRAAATLESSARQSITPQVAQRFVGTARERIRRRLPPRPSQRARPARRGRGPRGPHHRGERPIRFTS